MVTIQNHSYHVSDRQLRNTLDQLNTDTWIMVDWTHESGSVQELIDQYLEFVEQCHRLGFKVQVHMRIVTALMFAQASEPIVFCGHTYNPFRFDRVVYAMEKNDESKSRNKNIS